MSSDDSEDIEMTDDTQSFGSHNTETDNDNDFTFSPASQTALAGVAFVPLTLSQIASFCSLEAIHVQGIVGGTEDQAAALLRFFSWNKEALVEAWMNDPEKVSRDSGVAVIELNSLEKPGPVVKEGNHSLNHSFFLAFFFQFISF